MVTAQHRPHLILSTVYLVRLSSLTTAFLVLLSRQGDSFTSVVTRSIQIILAGQCFSIGPIAHFFMSRGKWPQPNWALVGVEVAKNISLIFLSMLIVFCLILLIGAPITSPYASLLLTCALASLILPTLVINNSFSKHGRRMRLVDRLLCAPLRDSPEMSFLRWNSMSVMVGAWIGGLTLHLDWQDKWKVYPVANILAAIIMSIICNCIYLLISSVSLVQKWTYY